MDRSSNLKQTKYTNIVSHSYKLTYDWLTKSANGGIWNYSNKIQLTSNPKVPDYELHNKEIDVTLYNSGYEVEVIKPNNS